MKISTAEKHIRKAFADSEAVMESALSDLRKKYPDGISEDALFYLMIYWATDDELEAK